MSAPLSPRLLAFELLQASEPQLSPDGTRVWYTRTRAEGRTGRLQRRIWEWSLISGRHRRVGLDVDSMGGRWSADGASYACVVRQGKGFAIMVLGAEGAPARPVTAHAQPIHSLAWAPDGLTLAYTTAFDPENPDEHPWTRAAPRVRATSRLDYKRDGRGYLGDTREQLFVVAIASGERRRLTAAATDHLAPQWSPDGKWLVVQASDWLRYGSQLLLIDPRSGQISSVSAAEGVVHASAWSPDGSQLLYAGAPEISSRTGQWVQPDFFSYDLADRTTRRLTDGFTACFPDHSDGCSADMAWLDARTVIVHGVSRGASALYRLDASAGTIERLYSWDELHSEMSVDAARRRLVFATSGPRHYGELLCFDLDRGDPGPRTALNERLLKKHQPARWEQIAVPREPWLLDAWLLAPPDFTPSRRYPIVLMVHGGPQAYYGFGFDLLQQCLATNGFLVLFCNPRGSTSYGQAFVQEVVGDYGGEDYRDVMAALEQVCARPYVDGERAGIVGHSYGGFMSAWAIVQSTRFRAAVVGEPHVDQVSLYGTGDDGPAWGKLELGGTPEARMAHYRERSPTTWASRARTPTLILHGEDDQRCPIGQGEQLFVALHEAGCPVEFVRYPGGDHWWFEGAAAWPDHREDVLRRTLDWFKRYLLEPHDS